MLNLYLHFVYFCGFSVSLILLNNVVFLDKLLSQLLDHFFKVED